MSSPDSTKPETIPNVDAPSTVIKNPDRGRYCSSNIRLSVALCALGFVIRDDAEPVAVAAELYFRKRPDCWQCRSGAKHDHIDIAFFHAPELLPDAPLAQLKNKNNEPLKFTPVDIEAWWRFRDPSSPSGSKFSIPGFDDALNAIRRVLEVREWLISVVKGNVDVASSRFDKNSIVTSSIRFASVIRACGFELLAFEKLPGRNNSRFVFPAKAVRVVDLIHKCHAQEESDHDSSLVTSHTSLDIYPDRRDVGDLCVDWMLWALEYHGRLLKTVEIAKRDHLMVEIREKGETDMPTVSGEHVTRLHSKMPKTLKREFLAHH